MKHVATPSFWKCFRKLPKNIQDLARQNFELLKENPYHPSLHFKMVRKYASVRVGKRYRAIAVEAEDRLLWFWIGTHGEYDKLIKR